MEKACDGSRRPVRGKQHQLKSSKKGRHMEAKCPCCHKIVRAQRMFGQVVFRRHEAPANVKKNEKRSKR